MCYNINLSEKINNKMIKKCVYDMIDVLKKIQCFDK